MHSSQQVSVSAGADSTARVSPLISALSAQHQQTLMPYAMLGGDQITVTGGYRQPGRLLCRQHSTHLPPHLCLEGSQPCISIRLAANTHGAATTGGLQQQQTAAHDSLLKSTTAKGLKADALTNDGGMAACSWSPPPLPPDQCCPAPPPPTSLHSSNSPSLVQWAQLPLLLPSIGTIGPRSSHCYGSHMSPPALVQ